MARKNVIAGRLIALAQAGLLVFLLAACMPPPAPKPRESLPPAGSRAENIVRCMAKDGYTGKILPDGTTQWDGLSKDAMPAFNAAQDTCGKAFPYEALTDAQVRQMYDLELANRQCLVKLGFDIPEAPSEQTYVDTYNTDKWWIAISFVPTDNWSAYQSAVAACPPPTYFN